MQAEQFKTRREFNNKFPSKIYLCTKCGKLTENENLCTKCGGQANGFFDGYKYQITEESEEIINIFTPIEMLRQEGEKDE